MNSSKEIVELFVDGKLNEAKVLFSKVMGQKITTALNRKKQGINHKGEVVGGGVFDDSSGNNDLCDSSDNSMSSGRSSVSEQDIKTFSKRLERHIRTIHPHQARDKILAKAETTGNKLNAMGKIRNK